MSPYRPTTLGYFSAPAGHLWEWYADDEYGHIAWHGNGGLLVFREELEGLLDACVPGGLPPLGALLLVVSAAQENYSASNTRIRLWEAAERASGSPDVPLGIADLWKRVGIGLEQIHALPANYRASGPARWHLLQTLFGEALRDPGRKLNPSHSRDIVTEFKQTPYVDVFQQRSPELNGVARLLADLSALEKAFQFCPPEHLERRLSTGLDQLPTRQLELPLPQPDDTPAPDIPADLLRALEHEGGELAQVAGLVRRMSAILHVPKAVTHRDEMPLGGVSDITNRGDPSRLLMTELAWDDLTFAVRLSQGEALYLRRESPPAEPPPRRRILIDTGIFMWGKPRLFALGAALALLRQKQGSQAIVGQVMAADGDVFMPITLDTVEDVRAQLIRLHPQPHPSAALNALLDDEASLLPEEEVFLITHPAACEQLTAMPLWQRLAAAVPLHTLLVDRDGALQLARHSLAGAKTLSEVRVDAEDLFEPPQPSKSTTPKPSPAALTDEAGRLPQFYRQAVWPLYHPAPPVRDELFEIPQKGYIGVSEAGCVCWWERSYSLVSQIIFFKKPAASLFLAAQEKQNDEVIFLVFMNPGQTTAEIAVIHLKHPINNSVYSVERGTSDTILPCLNSGRLIVHLDDRSEAYDILDEAVKVASIPRAECKGWPVFDGAKFHAHGTHETPCSFLSRVQNVAERGVVRRFLTNIESVSLNSMGRLMVLAGDHVFRLKIVPEVGFDWEGCSVSREGFKRLQPVAQPRWDAYGLKIALFPDGRRVVVDPRGFIHVCDAGDDSDEISLLLVKGHTAAWTPNGKYFGESNLLLYNAWPKPMSEVLPLCQKLFRPHS